MRKTLPRGHIAPYLRDMTYIAWTARIIVFLVIAGFLHYTLPQREIVRIVSTYEERQDFGGWTSIFWASAPSASAQGSTSRDVLFIQSVKADGSTMVYRNEDTGWGWPPYFKFDTADLQTEAADAISTREDPRWYAVRSYGWRSNLFSIFPNALSMRPVESPDVRLIPWFNIIFLTVATLIVLTIWRLWRNFRQSRIDPWVDDIEDDVNVARGRISGFFARMFGRRK